STRCCETRCVSVGLSVACCLSVREKKPGQSRCTAFVEKLQGKLRRPGPNTAAGRLMRTKTAVHIADVRSEPGFFRTAPAVRGPPLAMHWCPGPVSRSDAQRGRAWWGYHHPS